MIKYLYKSVLKKSSLINLKKHITFSTETVEVLGFRCFKCDGEEGKRDGGIAVLIRENVKAALEVLLEGSAIKKSMGRTKK